MRRSWWMLCILLLLLAACSTGDQSPTQAGEADTAKQILVYKSPT